jgi:hypothetical protein
MPNQPPHLSAHLVPYVTTFFKIIVIVLCKTLEVHNATTTRNLLLQIFDNEMKEICQRVTNEETIERYNLIRVNFLINRSPQSRNLDDLGTLLFEAISHRIKQFGRCKIYELYHMLNGMELTITSNTIGQTPDIEIRSTLEGFWNEIFQTNSYITVDDIFYLGKCLTHFDQESCQRVNYTNCELNPLIYTNSMNNRQLVLDDEFLLRLEEDVENAIRGLYLEMHQPTTTHDETESSQEMVRSEEIETTLEDTNITNNWLREVYLSRIDPNQSKFNLRNDKSAKERSEQRKLSGNERTEMFNAIQGEHYTPINDETQLALQSCEALSKLRPYKGRRHILNEEDDETEFGNYEPGDNVNTYNKSKDEISINRELASRAFALELRRRFLRKRGMTKSGELITFEEYFKMLEDRHNKAFQGKFEVLKSLYCFNLLDYKERSEILLSIREKIKDKDIDVMQCINLCLTRCLNKTM